MRRRVLNKNNEDVIEELKKSSNLMVFYDATYNVGTIHSYDTRIFTPIGKRPCLLKLSDSMTIGTNYIINNSNSNAYAVIPTTTWHNYTFNLGTGDFCIFGISIFPKNRYDDGPQEIIAQSYYASPGSYRWQLNKSSANEIRFCHYLNNSWHNLGVKDITTYLGKPLCICYLRKNGHITLYLNGLLALDPFYDPYTLDSTQSYIEFGMVPKEIKYGAMILNTSFSDEKIKQISDAFLKYYNL